MVLVHPTSNIQHPTSNIQPRIPGSTEFLLGSLAMPEQLKPQWVDTPDGVREAADRCRAAGRLALDTEADSMYSYFHKVCLIQVTADGRNMVIDPLAMEPIDLQPLWEVVGDPTVPLLMHGADYDIRVLDRDYGVPVRGLQDTQIMAQLLGESKTGLAAMLEQELGVHLDKKHQRADWGRRPLTRSQVAYAAADTAYLGELVALLRARLETLGRWAWAEEEFRSLETVRYVEPEPDPLAFERLKGSRGLRGAARDRIYSLHRWRESVASDLDLPPFKVLGNQQLMALAENPPPNLAGLGEVQGIGPRAVRRWGRELLRLLRDPEPAPERAAPPRTPPPPAAVRSRMQRLTAARDARAEELGLQPGLVCPRAVIDAVASRQPACWSLTDLIAAGLRGWRIEVLGEAFLEALTGD
jgi:ribonuclease D